MGCPGTVTCDRRRKFVDGMCSASPPCNLPPTWEWSASRKLSRKGVVGSKKRGSGRMVATRNLSSDHALSPGKSAYRKLTRYFSRLSFPVPANLPPQSLVQTRLHFHRIIDQIRIVVQVDRKPCLLHQNSAVPARLEVQLDFLHHRGFQVAIDISGNAPEYAIAVQCFPSCRK